MINDIKKNSAFDPCSYKLSFTKLQFHSITTFNATKANANSFSITLGKPRNLATLFQDRRTPNLSTNWAPCFLMQNNWLQTKKNMAT